MNDTFQDTPSNGPSAINETVVALIRSRLVVSVSGPVNVEPVQDHTDEVELLPVGEYTIYPDTLKVEARPAAEIEILTDVERPEQKFSDQNLERIREIASKQIAAGLREPMTIVLTDGTTTGDFVADKIVRPPFSTEQGQCFAGLAGVQIEHASTEEKMTTVSFKAEAVLEVITDMADYRNDMDRLELPTITVRSLTNKVKPAAHITGGPQELKELGQFLIEQADRFQGYLDEVDAHA